MLVRQRRKHRLLEMLVEEGDDALPRQRHLPLVVAMQVEGDSLLIGRHIHHSAFSLADGSFSQSDEEEVGQQSSTCSALPRHTRGTPASPRSSAGAHTKPRRYVRWLSAATGAHITRRHVQLARSSCRHTARRQRT
jgi:hypothetical protein